MVGYFVSHHIAAKPITRLIIMYAIAVNVWPLDQRDKASAEKVEKVENPPQNPVSKSN